MAIDIENLKESELLPALGNGDWLIALPDAYPDILITSVWRQQIYNDVALQFVRWVMSGVSVEIDHDIDPPWDHSGHGFRYQVDPQQLLIRYKTLQEWLDQEHTGNSTASFVSGMGQFWDTYSEDVSRDVDDKVFELLKAHLQSVLGYDEDDDIWMEILDEVTWTQSAITHAIMLSIGLLSTEEVWENLQSMARIQIAEERSLSEEWAIQHRAMRQKVDGFWHYHFADLEGKRIEKPQFKALNLRNRLQNVLEDTDPSVIEAIVEVGLPGLFSNSVAMEIQQIARRALG